MTRSQVRYLLGTPMVPDVFDNDRWDYLYYFKHGRHAPAPAAPGDRVLQGRQGGQLRRDQHARISAAELARAGRPTSGSSRRI